MGADGFDLATLGVDLDAIADHVGIDRFHLVTHATGGMVGVRYAMADDQRLLSLVLTDASSATMVGSRLTATSSWLGWSRSGRGPSSMPPCASRWAPSSFDWTIILTATLVWQIVHQCFELGDPTTLARFIRDFYYDPDPQVAGLRRITCPTLVLVGEHDLALIKPSRLMAAEIPGAQLVVVPGAGHMTAIEAPAETASDIATFLSTHS